MAIAANQRGSAGSAQNYSRLVSTFGPSTTVTDQAPLVAKDVLDKVMLLSFIAMASGTVTAIAKPTPGFIWVALLAALGAGFVGIIRPARAKVLAPIYAIAIGAVLGWISELYASRGNGAVVPYAVLGTTGIFFGVLALYRSGIVRVTSQFVRVTMVSGFGLLGLMIAVMLGVRLPATSHAGTYLIVFGIVYLIVAIMNLFVDFNFVYMAQRAGVSKEGEWFAALSIMFALVMVYLSLLRILGGRR